LVDVRGEGFCEMIAFFFGEEFGKELHDAWIGVEAGKGFEIFLAPRSEDKARCC
jgi:hypothetical protein